jgi:hypothetical protein
MSALNILIEKYDKFGEILEDLERNEKINSKFDTLINNNPNKKTDYLEQLREMAINTSKAIAALNKACVRNSAEFAREGIPAVIALLIIESLQTNNIDQERLIELDFEQYEGYKTLQKLAIKIKNEISEELDKSIKYCTIYQQISNKRQKDNLARIEKVIKKNDQFIENHKNSEFTETVRAANDDAINTYNILKAFSSDEFDTSSMFSSITNTLNNALAQYAIEYLNDIENNRFVEILSKFKSYKTVLQLAPSLLGFGLGAFLKDGTVGGATTITTTYLNLKFACPMLDNTMKRNLNNAKRPVLLISSWFLIPHASIILGYLINSNTEISFEINKMIEEDKNTSETIDIIDS